MMAPVKSQANSLPDRSVKQRLAGAGTAAMLIVLLGMLASQLFLSPKVKIERRVEPGTGAHIQRSPSPSQLLSWSTELQLSHAQVNRMKSLDNEEKLSLAPVTSLISKAEKEFDLFMRDQSQRAFGLTEIQVKAKPLSELSLQKRQLESKFSDQALAALSGRQKIKARQLWKKVNGKVAPMEAPSVE